MITPAENEALYLFYLTGFECSENLQVPGVSEAGRLFAHCCTDLVALLDIVSIDDFCGPEAERRLGDLEWVSQRGIRHERVIEHGFRRGALLPARFGTLFSSIQALDRFIQKNKPKIVDFLGAVRGREEWGIKMLLDRAAAKKWLSARIAATSAGQTPASPGLRYVQERRAQATAETQLRQWLFNSFESVARSLDKYATAQCQRKIFEGAITGDSRELVLNLALLVPHRRVKALFSHIETINLERAEQGLSCLLNGPWPPYSFCPPLAMPSS